MSAELDRWNQRFSAENYVFGTEPNQFLASQHHRLAPNSRVLSIADGEGRNSVWLACQGLKVDAVDFSPIGIEKAKRLAAAKGVTVAFQHADILAWDWPVETYDVVVGIFFQFTGPDGRAKIFKGMQQAVRPGGLLMIQGYRPKQLEYGTGGPKVLENLYTTELLRTAFKDMEILHLEEHDSEVDEGPGHSGMSALIDLVARKT